MAFTKYNNPNKKRSNKRRPTKENADLFALNTMLSHRERGIELSADFYNSLSRKNQTGSWD